MPNEFKNLTPDYLSHFTGTEEYTRFMNLILTDGTKFVVECNCHWLLVAIASHQTATLRKKSGGMQFWTLKPSTKKGFTATLVCDDGNGNVLVKQEIEYSDFPFKNFVSGDNPTGEFKIWVEEGSINGKDTVWVAMLPSER